MSRHHDSRSSGRYPRTLRVNQVLREVLADELERLVDVDERIGMATVTSVSSSPDFRHATVFLSSITDDMAVVLEEHRAELQRAIGRQVRLKRTPYLSFAADPGVLSGQRVDEVLRRLRDAGEPVSSSGSAAGEAGAVMHGLGGEPGGEAVSGGSDAGAVG